jgi:putative sterol carrier protein
MAELNVSQIMESIPEYFNPEKATGIEAVVQCFFSGNQASNWFIVIKDQTCKVEKGQVDHPDITIKAKGEEGVKLFTGEMDPMRAFLLRKVKVSGDMALGMKLLNLFDRPY